MCASSGRGVVVNSPQCTRRRSARWCFVEEPIMNYRFGLRYFSSPPRRVRYLKRTSPHLSLLNSRDASRSPRSSALVTARADKAHVRGLSLFLRLARALIVSRQRPRCFDHDDELLSTPARAAADASCAFNEVIKEMRQWRISSNARKFAAAEL